MRCMGGVGRNPWVRPLVHPVHPASTRSTVMYFRCVLVCVFVCVFVCACGRACEFELVVCRTWTRTIFDCVHPHMRLRLRVCVCMCVCALCVCVLKTHAHDRKHTQTHKHTWAHSALMGSTASGKARNVRRFFDTCSSTRRTGAQAGEARRRRA